MRLCNHTSKVLLLLILSLLLYNCNKTEIYYVGPKGELKGTVVLRDGDSILPDRSGVLVYADGSSPHVQAVTDKDGNFSLKDLTTGIYDIVFQKDGFCTFKEISYQFVGGNEPVDLTYQPIFKIPDFQISDVAVSPSSNLNGNFTGTLIGNFTYYQEFSVRLYYSDTPDVSYNNYISTNWCPLNYYGSQSIDFGYDYKVSSELKLAKVHTVYMVAYPSAFYTLSYLDIATGNQIYFIDTSKPSNVVTFTLP